MEYTVRDNETEVVVDVVDSEKLEKDREARLRAYQSAMEEAQKKKEESK